MLGSVGPPPEVVAGYRVLRQLGQGGMATVYLAQHQQTGQHVALKRIRDRAKDDPEFKERFLREVRAAQQLDHPNICKVFAGGEDGAAVFMACEVIDGGDLNDLLRKMGGTVPAAAACVFVCELLEALDHAHNRGLIHRDIKPANVMLTAAGTIKLVDFGIAKNHQDQKLTATGMVLGTPAYMSPEQARGMPLDARSDLFSVGALLVELLTGKNPFESPTATATVMRILLEPAPPLFCLDPTAPGVLQRVCAGLLERDANLRYPSARAALDDLLPYKTLVLAEFPQLAARSLSDPLNTKDALLAAQARFEGERAGDLHALGEPAAAAAAMALFRATRLVPHDAATQQRFEAACHRQFDFTPTDKRITDVEAQAAAQPGQIALLKRAADLHAIVKNPHGQALWLSRYLQAQPGDELAQRQWTNLLSGPPGHASAATRGKLSTREIVDGIKTGGWRSAASNTSPHTTFRPLTHAPPARAAPSVVQQNARAAAAAPVIVIAARDGTPRGTWMVGAVVVGALGLGGLSVLQWGGKQAVRSVQASITEASHTVDVDVEVRVRTMKELQAAATAIAQKISMDAMIHADAALRMTPTGNEAARAYFIKAQARMLDGDKLGAERELKQYFDTAPPTHPDYERAQAMYASMPSALRNPTK